MKENRYDDKDFFLAYSCMERSVKGLEGAGEWHALRGMLPQMRDKRVLDLGCGYGWHCRYAAEHGARYVLGTDISARMIELARQKNSMPGVEYRVEAIEDLDIAPESFDVVLSSLALHYLESFVDIACKAARWLTQGGSFVFSVEHPIFTAQGPQQWHCDPDGNKEFWPVDRYFDEGRRDATFLGENVVKYHKTLTTYINGLLKAGFDLREFIEPQPDAKMLAMDARMQEELRRPMMMLISAVKR